MVLHIIRHADPDYPNNTITEFGRREAEALAQYMKTIPLDRVFTSPLGRAIDTALPTCREKGLEYTVLPWTVESMDYMRPCDRPGNCSYTFTLTEGVRDFSDLTGESRNGSIENLYKNSDEFFASLGYERHGARYKVVTPNHEHIAVFCHGGFGGAWISHLLLRPAEMSWISLRLRTTSISTFEFGNSNEYTTPLAMQIGAIPHIVLAGLRVNDR
ncbi:MAG: histidine phosphatase family protein [Clostridia bacterium]|nr:histidine phosphatase family protein [Clostridia bacterium]